MGAFHLSIKLILLISVTSEIGASEYTNNGVDIEAVIERMVNEQVNRKVSEMRKEFQTRLNDLRLDMEQVNMKHKSVIEELKSELDTLKAESHINAETMGENIQVISSENLSENAKREVMPDESLSSAAGEVRRRRAGVANVAFCAYLSHYETPDTGAAVRYDKVLLNEGSGYNNYTGAFTAPVSGVYLFNFHFDVTNKTTYLRLVVDGVNIVDAVANQHDTADRSRAQNMSGNSAIVRVNQGQAVLVEIYQNGHAEVAASEIHRFSTFSGVLLY